MKNNLYQKYMRICFYFVLFFTAKCLNFCCEECCGDCCCDWWYNLLEDCYKKSNKEEEKKKDDFWNDYREEQKEKELRHREEIEKQKEEIEKQKEELKNKIREYLSNIENQVENIKRNLGEDKSTKEGLFNQISKINELIENFKNDNYFVRNSIEKIRKDLKELQDLCSKAGIINFDDFYKKNEEWERFLEENGIHKQYEEEKIITPEKFSLDNTLEKLNNNFGTYLLEIFKTRLFPVDENEDKYKYKNEFMEFYKEYNIGSLKDIWDEEYLQDFYEKIFQKVKCDMLDKNEKQAIEIYKEGLLQEEHLYLGYALLTDGDETKIIEKIHGQIRCAIFTQAAKLKDIIIPPLINSFKHNIVEIIKDSFQEQLNGNKNLQKNNSENIKEIALNKYNEAIKNLNGGKKIELTFFTSYQDEIGSDFFPKEAKLSVLFDYVLSKGRDFYAKDDNDNVDEKIPYLTYEKEKGKIELTTIAKFGDSLNDAIKNNENITIGKFYEKNKPQVFIFFKSDN